MFSSNDKLIDEVRKRLVEFKRKNFYNYHKANGLNFLEAKRLSTLVSRRSSLSRRGSTKLKTKRNLIEDKINLRLVPVIKSIKAIMSIRKDNNDNHKRYHTEGNAHNNMKKSKINSYSNSNSKLYITTYSNGPSISNSIGKTKMLKKRHLFLSPFQAGKNRSKMFKNLVNISKVLHSPKNKENNLVNNIFNVKSIKRFNNFETKNNKKDENVTTSEKIFKLENSFFHDNKATIRFKTINKKKRNIFLLEESNNRSDTFKKLLKNGKNRRANCYYNKLHLNRMHDIIEKYSYNNKD